MSMDQISTHLHDFETYRRLLKSRPGQLRTFRFVEIREAGMESFSGVARELTRMGISTTRGLDK